MAPSIGLQLPAMSESKEGGGSSGFSSFMDDLKDKFSESKLHDAKVQLIHKKFGHPSLTPPPPPQ